MFPILPSTLTIAPALAQNSALKQRVCIFRIQSEGTVDVVLRQSHLVQMPPRRTSEHQRISSARVEVERTGQVIHGLIIPLKAGCGD